MKNSLAKKIETMKKIVLVVPAYNEENVITEVVNEILLSQYNLVVVDDNSTDSTYLKLLNTNAIVCRHPINLGQGASIQTGIACALKRGAEYIVTFDADGQHSLSDVAKLISKLDEGYDIVLGSRFLDKSSNVPSLKRLVLKLGTLLTKITTGLELSDTHNGLRAFNRRAAQNIKITNNRMAHASQILGEISRLKLKYCEVPVTVSYTEYSIAKGQKVSNSFNILWESFAESWLRK